MSELLEIIYASAPKDHILIQTLEIKSSAFDTLYYCNGYQDITARLENNALVTFTASAFDLQLPARDSSGNQRLVFAIENVSHIAQSIIDKCLEFDAQVFVTFRQYTSMNLNSPIEPPITLSVLGGTFSESTVQIECAYYDILNSAFPRKRYTAEFSKGLKYFY